MLTMRHGLMSGLVACGLAAGLGGAQASPSGPVGIAPAASVPVETVQFGGYGYYGGGPYYGYGYGPRPYYGPPRVYGPAYGPRVVCRVRPSPWGPRRVCFERY